MCLALSPSPLFSQEKGTDFLILPSALPALSLHLDPPDLRSEQKQDFGSFSFSKTLEHDQ